ncbi:MAG: TM2 domain-containing protein [Ruminococcaceae bacterium]|jgi:restriction system protein|nr:TM2 domain-containing protein [Oscillospiraceae bacterium]
MDQRPGNGSPVVQSQPQQPQFQTPAQTPVQRPVQGQVQPVRQYETIYCSTCGQQIAKVALACPFCGAPVYQNQPQQSQQPPQIIINNSNSNANVNMLRNGGYAGIVPKPKNKWVALLLWFFLGFVGGHKFYEGKTLLGIVYIFTAGLFGIGWIIDFFGLLFKPNPYYV